MLARRRFPGAGGRTRWVVAIGVLVIAAVAGTATAGTLRHRTHHVATLVRLHKTVLGRVLVDARGRTVYAYTADRMGRSVCYGACAGVWPPLLSKTRKPALAKGVRRALVGITKRKDGKLQITYRGHPLYTFSGDTKAGQVKGQGYRHVWYALAANGKLIKKMSAASHSTSSKPPAGTTTTSGGGAWG